MVTRGGGPSARLFGWLAADGSQPATNKSISSERKRKSLLFCWERKSWTCWLLTCCSKKGWAAEKSSKKGENRKEKCFLSSQTVQTVQNTEVCTNCTNCAKHGSKHVQNTEVCQWGQRPAPFECTRPVALPCATAPSKQLLPCLPPANPSIEHSRWMGLHSLGPCSLRAAMVLLPSLPFFPPVALLAAAALLATICWLWRRGRWLGWQLGCQLHPSGRMRMPNWRMFPCFIFLGGGRLFPGGGGSSPPSDSWIDLLEATYSSHR